MTLNNRAIKMLARNGWKLSHGVKLFVAMTVALVFTWPAWSDMISGAMQNDLARPGVLVLPIIVWLVWVRRSRFRYVRPGGHGLGLILLIAGVQLYVAGNHLYDIRSAWRMGATLIMAGAFLTVTGKSVAKQFLPAWMILPFLVPVPETLVALIADPIQLFEAQFIAMIYGLFGIGVQIFESPGSSRMLVSGKTLPLESVCKGLPTIISLLLICYGFVFGSPMRPLVRLSLLVITPFIALLCSAMALGGTLWLYDGHSALVTADFVIAMSQWVTLLIAFLLIAATVRLLSWASVPVHQYHLASTSS